MTARKLRGWHGVKPVASPAGTAIITRLRTTPADDRVLDQVAEHLGRLRRADLAAISRLAPPGGHLDTHGRHQARKDQLNRRKRALTAGSSSRWAGAIYRGNDEQAKLARRNQKRHIASLHAAVTAIKTRLAQPTGDTLIRAQRAGRKQGCQPRGYATQAERYQKQRRLQALLAELRQVTADYDAGRVRVTEGGRRLARTRHNLDATGLTHDQWREQWNCARWLIQANGSSDETYGNLTITVTPAGEVSLRLPRPLEHLANARHGRYALENPARFSYRAGEWAARVTGGQSVAYEITRKPGRGGVYLTASWAITRTPAPEGETRAAGPVIGVDLNDGHLAARRLDEHGNPVGAPARIDCRFGGTSGRNDAQVRHAVTRLLLYAARAGVTVVAVEDLDFADARDTGRETMGRGRRGRRFRRTVAGIPAGVFRNRLVGMAARSGITLLAVNPAYTSAWGGQHWQAPYKNVTRHQAAATVIGRRAQGHQARRRDSVTRTRPADHVVRATDQAGPGNHRVTASRHQDRMRGSESRPPAWHEPLLAGRATVTPATAGRNDQLRM